MNFPTELKYTKDHEWIRVEGDCAYVGITDYAQKELGEIVYVDIPTEGEHVAQEEAFGSIENRFRPVDACMWRDSRSQFRTRR